MTPSLSLSDAANRYLSLVANSRSENTHRTYTQAINRFLEVVTKHKVNIAQTPPTDASADWVGWYVASLKQYAPATESLYLTALVSFYEYLSAEQGATVNLDQVRSMVKRRQRKVTPRLPPFPREEIENILKYVDELGSSPVEDEREHLRHLRDRAFILTLADTGLRIAEACRLTRGQVDFAENKAIVAIKGGRESVVRFSKRSLSALKVYLSVRGETDGASGRALASLPIFARHDDGAGKKVLRLNTMGAREIVDRAVAATLGAEGKGRITPHTFRHYFVTVVLRASGGNLKLAQELARHKNVSTTQRYAHLSDDDLDEGYHEIFNKR